jgi:hypothetical protein
MLKTYLKRKHTEVRWEDPSSRPAGAKVSEHLCQKTSQEWWLMPRIPVRLEVEVAESQSKASLGQKSETLLERDKLKKKGLEVWLKWKSTCLVGARP